MEQCFLAAFPNALGYSVAGLLPSPILKGNKTSIEKQSHKKKEKKERPRDAINKVRALAKKG